MTLPDYSIDISSLQGQNPIMKRYLRKIKVNQAIIGYMDIIFNWLFVRGYFPDEG